MGKIGGDRMGRDFTMNIFGIPPIVILFAVIAYFVYGNSVSAALAVVLLGFLWAIAGLLAWIPFIGIFVYYYTMQWLFDWVADLTGLARTWVIDIMQVIYLAIGVLIYIVITLVTVRVIGIPHRECRIIDGRKVCKWAWR